MDSAFSLSCFNVMPSPEIYYHMALLRQQQGQAEQARQLAGRAKSLGPNPDLERKLQHLILSLVEPPLLKP